jgi:hypothetical protein
MAQMKQVYDVLILIARPAAGKSELIAYLKGVDTQSRIRRFHVGQFIEIDDFPMLWAWLEEDAILQEMGKPRLHTTEDGYFTHPYFWDVLIRRIGLDYEKYLREHPAFHDLGTAILEFSRGAQHGGYGRAFQHLSDEILRRAAVLYIEVSYEESVRKNERRYNQERAHTILEHGLPDDKMEVLYRDTDWDRFSADNPHFLSVRGNTVPYAVLENEDDATSRDGEELGSRLEGIMEVLWQRYLQCR